MEAIKEKLAAKMDEMGDKIESNTERLQNITDDAAIRLRHGAEQVRSIRGEEMARQLLNRYPVGSMMAAVALGIFFGRALRR